MKLLPFEIDWARVIGRAFVPAGALDGAMDHIDAGARYGEECASSPWHAAIVMRISLWLAWFAPMWLQARPRTFGGLDATAQARLLEQLQAHRVYLVRTSAMFLKLLLCQVLLCDEATLAQLGAYDLAPTVALRRSAS
jgi:hypothetical protein